MVDNITLNSGSGGAVLATDDISSVHYQIIKLAHGALDSATVVSQAAPLPVDIRAENASVTVDNGGTFAVQVDGDALTALQLIDNLVLAEDAAHQTADPGVQVLAVRKATPADLSGADGDYEPLQMDSGRLWTSATIDAAIPAGDNNIGNVDIASSVALDVSAATVTVDLGANNDVTIDNSSIVHAEDAVHNTGDAGIMPLAVRNDTLAALAGTDGDYAPLQVDASGGLYVANANLTTLAGAVSGSEMQVDVVAALPAGTNAIGKLAANSGVDIGDVDVLSIAAGSNLIGDVGIGVRTSGGMSIMRSIDIDETEEAVKASAGQLYSVAAFNTTAAPLYLKFYNATVATVSVGTTTPVLTLLVPGNADSDGAGFVWNHPVGFAFDTAITVACTTGIADNDTGAPGSNACLVNIGYA